MAQKHHLYLPLIGLTILLLTSSFLTLQTPTLNNLQKISDSPFSHTFLTESYQSTVNAERTAIAVFTQNPTLALSSTPYYAEIIYNEVVRNLTEVPYPVRGSYLGPVTATHMARLLTTTPTSTPVAVISAMTTPMQRCTTTISTHVLSDLSREIILLLEQQEIEARVSVTSLGVEGIDTACTIPFQPVRSRFQIYIKVESIDDTSQLTELTVGVLAVTQEKWDNMEYVSNNSVISIYFDDGDGGKLFTTTHDAMVEAYEDGLQGDNLIETLGGFAEDN